MLARLFICVVVMGSLCSCQRADIKKIGIYSVECPDGATDRDCLVYTMQGVTSDGEPFATAWGEDGQRLVAPSAGFVVDYNREHMKDPACLEREFHTWDMSLAYVYDAISEDGDVIEGLSYEDEDRVSQHIFSHCWTQIYYDEGVLRDSKRSLIEECERIVAEATEACNQMSLMPDNCLMMDDMDTLVCLSQDERKSPVGRQSCELTIPVDRITRFCEPPCGWDDRYLQRMHATHIWDITEVQLDPRYD